MRPQLQEDLRKSAEMSCITPSLLGCSASAALKPPVRQFTKAAVGCSSVKKPTASHRNMRSSTHWCAQDHLWGATDNAESHTETAELFGALKVQISRGND